MNKRQFLILGLTLTILGCKTTDKACFDFTNKAELNKDSHLVTGWYYLAENNHGIKRQLDRDTAWYLINPTLIVVACNIVKFKIYENNQGSVGLSMKLDKNGTTAWSDATKKAALKNLAFVVDDKLIYVSFVNSQITGGITALNRGIYTKDELKEFQKKIQD